MRLDLYMVKEGLVGGRDRAKELIKEGMVLVSGEITKKPSLEIDGQEVKLLAEDVFVGRGALKLKKAIEYFSLSVEDKICLDAGASTGGFTEIMLKGGAKKVYAVDVGEGQLKDVLKADKRVINLEKTDIRSLSLSEKADFFTADVSFISLKQVLFPIFNLTCDEAMGVCLIKPQFEAGAEKIGKNGIVKDKRVHISVICDIINYAKSIGFSYGGLTHSPIKGQKGNIEYLLLLKKGPYDGDIDVEKEVNLGWEAL